MLATLLAAAISATAFNLECSGKATDFTGPILGGKKTSEAGFETTFRVDTGAGRWCQDICAVSRPIVEIAETTMTLVKEDTSHGELIIDSEVVISRETGRYIYRNRFGTLQDMLVHLEEGSCRRTPFTGLPTKLF